MILETNTNRSGLKKKRTNNKRHLKPDRMRKFGPFYGVKDTHGWTKAIPLCLDHSNIFWIRESTYFKKGGYVWLEINWTIRLSYDATKGKPGFIIIVDRRPNGSQTSSNLNYSRRPQLLIWKLKLWLRLKSTWATAIRFVEKFFCS